MKSLYLAVLITSLFVLPAWSQVTISPIHSEYGKKGARA